MACLVIGVVLNARTALADLPPIDPAAAPWLARAETDIAGLSPNVPEGLEMLAPDALAVELYATAPTEARRKLAGQIIDRSVEYRVALHKSAEWEWTQGAYLVGAVYHARIGNFDDARRLLLAANREPTTSPTTQPYAELARSGLRMAEAETDLLLGDRAGFEKVKVDWLGYSGMMHELSACGHADLAELVARWWENHPEVDPKWPTTPAELQSPGDDRVEAVRRLTHPGTLADAMKAAESLVTDPPKNKDASSYYHAAVEAYSAIAQESVNAHDVISFRLCRAAVVELLQKHPEQSTSTWIDGLLQLCVLAGDREGFRILAPPIHAKLIREPWDPSNIELLTQIAQGYAAFGDVADYQSVVKEAERFLSVPQDDASATDDQKARSAQTRALGYLQLAAARARMSDPAGVERDKKASMETAKLDADTWDEGWWWVVRGYADAGLFGRATGGLAEFHNDEFGLLASYIARHEAAARRYNDALKLVANVPLRQRIGTEYQMVVCEVRAGNVSDVAARPDSMKTPYERAMLELAIGQTLIGKEYFGQFRSWMPDLGD